MTANLNSSEKPGKCGFDHTSMTLTTEYFTDLTGKQRGLLQRLRNRCSRPTPLLVELDAILPNLKNHNF